MSLLKEIMDDHRDKNWFARVQEAKPGQLYSHGIAAIQRQSTIFHQKNLQHAKPYTIGYQPNPFRYQYDLMVHIWLNYFSILEQEVAILRSLGKPKHDDEADELTNTRKLYGMSRSDFLFGAAELRWPTEISSQGARTGKFVRDPWSERRVDALSHERIKYVVTFGGAGQGKTTVFANFSLMMFDHFLFTEKGARCMISTVNKDKLNSVSWPSIVNANRSSVPGISLYAGRGEVKGDWTIKRPQNKDTAGVFKGVLLGSSINEATVIDKLTGSHGHPFVGYTLDEAQSTSAAPMQAAQNFAIHSGDIRVMIAGNYDEDGDTLGSNARPPLGWKSVTEHSGKWETETTTGRQAIVLHFNNEDCPAMDARIAKIFPHMPNEQKRNDTYNAKVRNINNLAYRRFWLGWRVQNLKNNICITQESIDANNAQLPTIESMSSIRHRMFSFDSAPAEIDRNFLMIGAEGICKQTGQVVFGPQFTKTLEKSTESIRYYRESTAQILKICSEFKITSGSGIVDFTGRPGHAERMDEANFVAQRLIYNQAVPDGIREDSLTKRIERPILLGAAVDFKNDYIASRICAHHVAETKIDFAAVLMRMYLQAGRLRGLNEALLDGISSHKFEEEICARVFEYKNSLKYGARFVLGCKKEFKKLFGFSPEILDTLFQMCYYFFIYRNIPLTHIESEVKILESQDLEEDNEGVNDLWDYYHLD